MTVQYNSGQLEEIKNSTLSSLDNVIETYHQLKSLSQLTGIEGDIQAEIDRVFKEADAIMKKLQERVESMKAGVLRKESDQEDSNMSVTNIMKRSNL